MHQLKFLPWQILINAALATLILVTCIDYGLTLILPLASQEQLIQMTASPLRLLYFTAIDTGIGVISVWVLERLKGRQFLINLSILWALILCLLLALQLKSFLPIPGIFLGRYYQFSLVGILLGVFGKGRRYYR